MSFEPKTLAEMAAETLEDGALSETLAVARTMHMLDRAQPQPIRAILTTIVDEESRHAALGWNMVRWAIEQGGDEVRLAVADAAQRLRSQCASVTLPAPEPVRHILGVYGQLDDAQMAEIHKEAWAHCVEPMLRAVLS